MLGQPVAFVLTAGMHSFSPARGPGLTAAHANPPLRFFFPPFFLQMSMPGMMDTVLNVGLG
jgi:hypothetical protein